MDAQTLQTLISLGILIFGIFSIWLNWRKGIPPQESNSLGGWRELYEQSHIERTRNEKENEREIANLMTKIAVQARELELLRIELALRAASRTGVNVSVVGSGANVGQSTTGDENSQSKT